MYQYPKELKESITARMLPPNNVGVPELVLETGIPKDTLYTWRSKARKGKVPKQSTKHGQLNSEEKFNAVLETATLNEIEITKYCRNKGMFPLQIDAWRKTCMNAHAPLAPKADRAHRNQAKKIKGLEKELRRKEKALAEAAALLILQKKVQFLWQDQEDEKPALRSVRK